MSPVTPHTSPLPPPPGPVLSGHLAGTFALSTHAHLSATAGLCASAILGTSIDGFQPLLYFGPASVILLVIMPA